MRSSDSAVSPCFVCLCVFRWRLRIIFAVLALIWLCDYLPLTCIFYFIILMLFTLTILNRGRFNELIQLLWCGPVLSCCILSVSIRVDAYIPGPYTILHLKRLSTRSARLLHHQSSLALHFLCRRRKVWAESESRERWNSTGILKASLVTYIHREEWLLIFVFVMYIVV